MNKRILFAVVALGVLSTASKCNFNLFGSPTQVNEDVAAQPQASPSPSPSATPIQIDSSCNATCSVHSLVIDEGDSIIPIGGSKEFHLTPYTEVAICGPDGKPTKDTKIIKTSKECDDPRKDAIQWSVSSSAISVLGDGFRAEVKRVGTGNAVLTAELEGKKATRNIQ